MDFSKIDLKDHQKLARIIIQKASEKEFKDRREFEKFRNAIIKENKGVIFHNLYFIRAYSDLLREGKISDNPRLKSLIQKRSVRTMSGVAPVTVLTKPYPCPGRCVYCPTDVRMPKSYLPSQPAAQRAFRQGFNPYTQVFVRLKALQMTGHEISKVELRIIGGTWSAYPKSYQSWFIKRCLQAMNEFPSQIANVRTDNMENLVKGREIISLYGKDQVSTVYIKSLFGSRVSFEKAIKENETAKIKCIGINIETRPDFIDKNEVKRLRSLGVTKVEMGVQTTSEKIQKFTGRGHTLEHVKIATRLLKDAGFKIGYHMMPNLPGSSIEYDKRMIGHLFENADYRPDYLKIYPCVVVPKSRLSLIYKKGDYKPYDDKVLEDVLLENMRCVPEWCRIDRIARDIPADDIESGFRVSNIRQILEKRLVEEGTPCRDIRYREIGERISVLTDVEFVLKKYDASGGQEYFLTFENKKKDKIIALLRLRFPNKIFINELKNSAIIREIHVYGRQIPVGDKLKGVSQHIGWGKKLLKKAERIAYNNGFNRVVVISGIGTREYYKKFGYTLVGTYMVKNLNHGNISSKF